MMSVQKRQQFLTVSNHVSWLDIFVINAVAPMRFVAKADIRDWPLVGPLCAGTGTIFIERIRTNVNQVVASWQTAETHNFGTAFRSRISTSAADSSTKL